MSTLTVDLPDDVTLEEARLLLALKLWETGRFSLGRAAEFSGYTKRAFMEVAAKHGIPIFNYSAEEFANEQIL
ncbi:MAG: UPF0175 family protein [Candidatus Hydrogenedentes bacterium]|nr:UPF0175 family protein [Candidatus Hydrogenedentota bacterium]